MKVLAIGIILGAIEAAEEEKVTMVFYLGSSQSYYSCNSRRPLSATRLHSKHAGISPQISSLSFRYLKAEWLAASLPSRSNAFSLAFLSSRLCFFTPSVTDPLPGVTDLPNLYLFVCYCH